MPRASGGRTILSSMERRSPPKLEKVGRTSAISKPELHARLRAWLSQAQDEDQIGDTAQSQGRTPWVWIRVGEHVYRLHADTKGSGVRRYLTLVDEHGDQIAWATVMSQQGHPTKVAFGPDGEVIAGFFLYLPKP